MLKLVLVWVAFCVPALAYSAQIATAFTPLGGSRWKADVVVTNDSSDVAIGEFTIYFAEHHFANLALSSGPTAWDPIVIQPDLGIPAPGFLDGLASSDTDALELGESIGTFQIEFDLIDALTPFALPFAVYDDALHLLETGTTHASIVDPNQVPEPQGVWLLALGCAFALRPYASRRIDKRTFQAMA